MKTQGYIAVVDYGVGNLFSLSKAFKKFSSNVIITENADEIKNASAIVLPGVGTFRAGMRGLKLRNLTEPVKQFADSGKPMLGICLGAQLLLSKGFEFGEFKGLGIIPGAVKKFPDLPKGIKVPHIGWNHIMPPSGGSWSKTILENIQEGSDVYFVHSYVLYPDSKEHQLALTRYGGYEFSSAIRKGNVYGCQFHPEKSGERGLTIIKNFINILK